MQSDLNLIKRLGDKVEEGDTILTVLYNDKQKFEDAFEYIEDAIYIDNIQPDVVKCFKN